MTKKFSPKDLNGVGVAHNRSARTALRTALVGPGGIPEGSFSFVKPELPQSGRLGCLVTTRQLASIMLEFINDPMEHGSNHSAISKMVAVWLTLIPKTWDDRLPDTWYRRLSDDNASSETSIGRRFRLGDEALCLVAPPGEDEPTKLAAYGSLLRLVRLILSVSDTLDIFRQEKFDRPALESFHRFMIKAVGWHAEDKLESLLKSYFADLLVRVTPLSERSRGVLRIFDGHLNRFLNILVLRGRNGHIRSIEFIRSLLESKRLWFALSDARREKAMNDHKKRLGTPLDPLSEESKMWLRRATTEVFEAGIKYVPGSALPTRSAGSSVTRSFGGAFEKYALDRLVHLTPSGHQIETAGMDADVFSRIRSFDESAALANKLMGEGLWERNPQLSDSCGQIFYDPKKHFSTTSLFEIGKDMASGKPHEVDYQAIPEPGKFRVITAGPESLYTAVRPFQQWMISVWKEYPLSTMRESWVDRFRQSVKSNDGIMVSGDYEATTDLIHGECTSVILQQLLENVSGIPIHMKKWVEWCLSPAIINYPDGTQVPMRNGQLMGNPLSFVFLCIANLSTLMRTFDGLGIEWRSLDAFINGDDIYFKIPYQVRGWPLDDPMSMYREWKSYARELNLNLSLGKNYVSERLAMINNVMIESGGSEVQYLRTALSIGHRVKSDAAVTAMTMSAVEEKLWLDRNPAASLVLILNFRHRFKSELMSVKVRNLPNFQPNWFFPKSLGGYGLKNYLNKPVEASIDQRKVAGYLMRNPVEQHRWNYLSGKTNLPESVKLALRAVRSVTQFERNKTVGPLTCHEDLSVQLDRLLNRNLASTRWIRDSGEPPRRFFSVIPEEILRCKYIPPLSRILHYREPHWRLAGVESSFPEPGECLHEGEANCSTDLVEQTIMAAV